MIDREVVAARVEEQWRKQMEDFRRVGMSLPEAGAGLATGRNGRGIYRLTLREAAKLAVAVVLAEQAR